VSMFSEHLFYLQFQAYICMLC